MAHNDPPAIFIDPVKSAAKAALVAAGIGEMDVSYSAIERNGPTGARILMSKVIPPVLNRAQDRTSGGTYKTWKGLDGNTYARAIKFTLVVHLDVTLWAESLAKCMDLLFGFLREIPRFAFDGQQPLQADPALVTLPDPGNRIELTCLEPLLPDDTTNTAKQYRASVVLRANGGVYKDDVVGISVTPQIVFPTVAP